MLRKFSLTGWHFWPTAYTPVGYIMVYLNTNLVLNQGAAQRRTHDDKI